MDAFTATSASRKVPGTWLYWPAGVLVVVVPLLAVWLAFPEFVRLTETLQQQGAGLEVPGRTTVHVAEPGDFALYAAGSQVSAVARGGGELLLDSELLVFLDGPDGEPVPLQLPGARITLSFGPTEWLCVAHFALPKSGEYAFTVELASEADARFLPDLMLTERHWPLPQVFKSLKVLLPLLLLALCSIPAGVGLAVYVFARRQDARPVPPRPPLGPGNS